MYSLCRQSLLPASVLSMYTGDCTCAGVHHSLISCCQEAPCVCSLPFKLAAQATLSLNSCAEMNKTWCSSYSTCHCSQGTRRTGSAGARPPQASERCTPACTCQTWSWRPAALLSASTPCSLRRMPTRSQVSGHLHAACNCSCADCSCLSKTPSSTWCLCGEELHVP